MTILTQIKEKKFYIGSLPLSIFVGCSIIIMISAWLDILPKSMIGGFAVILPLGWLWPESALSQKIWCSCHFSTNRTFNFSV